jgi:D-amino-acid dehydrogenase
VVDDALHIAATPMGQRLRVAGTAEFAGYDDKLTPSRVENLFDLLLSIFPSFKPHLDRQQCSPWTGFRPVSSDGVPRIGRLKFENLYANTGHGHLGWTLAAGSSRLLADLIGGGRGEIDRAPYDAERS